MNNPDVVLRSTAAVILHVTRTNPQFVTNSTKEDMEGGSAGYMRSLILFVHTLNVVF